MNTDTEVVKQFYSALNRNDVPAALELLDPQIVRTEFEGTPTGGTYRGHQELATHMAQGRSTWAEGSCSPDRYFVNGDKVVVDVHVHVRLKNETKWIDGRVGDAFALRDHLITEFRSFLKLDQALSWAGIDEKK